MAISNPSLAQIKKALTEMLPKLKPLSVPTGMISAFHTVPEGWLQCNGAAVSRTTYAALFAVIGTKYGSGDGSTTFNLPNLHHRFIEGTNTSGRLGAYDCAGSSFTGAFRYAGNEGGPSTAWRSVAYSDFDASRSSSKYGSSSTVQPESIRLIPCIKS